MDAIEALLSRQSATRLSEPAPEAQARAQIFRAALRAPDHGRLRPWRFLIVEGDARARLGEALARAAGRLQPDISEDELARLRANPLRAPLLLVMLARLTDHPKVPELEQLLSVGCAAENMLVAAHALGFGGIWRSGAITFSRELREELELTEEYRVLGFLYLGTGDGPAKPVEEIALEDHFAVWEHGK